MTNRTRGYSPARESAVFRTEGVSHYVRSDHSQAYTDMIERGRRREMTYLRSFIKGRTNQVTILPPMRSVDTPVDVFRVEAGEGRTFTSSDMRTLKNRYPAVDFDLSNRFCFVPVIYTLYDERVCGLDLTRVQLSRLLFLCMILMLLLVLGYQSLFQPGHDEAKLGPVIVNRSMELIKMVVNQTVESGLLKAVENKLL